MGLFDCEELNNGSCRDCDDREVNRIIHVAFVKNTANTSIDKSTAALYMSTLLAAELACNAIIIRNVNGVYDADTTVGTGFGREGESVNGMTHTLTYQDKDAANKDVVEFYNSFKRQARGYVLHYFTDTKGWEVASTITVKPKVPITDDNTTFIQGNVDITWRYKDSPVPYAANTTELDECQVLFDGEALTLADGGGETNQTINGHTVTIQQGSNLDVDIDTDYNGVVSLEVQTSAGAAFTGIDVALSGADVITLSKTAIAVAVGTYELNVIATNACGLQGVVSIILTVTAP